MHIIHHDKAGVTVLCFGCVSFFAILILLQYQEVMVYNAIFLYLWIRIFIISTLLCCCLLILVHLVSGKRNVL